MAEFLMNSEYQTPPPPHHPDPPLWVKYLDHVIKLFHKHAYNIIYFSDFFQLSVSEVVVLVVCV